MADSKLDKQNLGEFLESNCERQLFLNLGSGRENWIKPFREIKKLKRTRIAHMLIKLGRKYEEGVYDELIKNNHNRAILNPNWKNLDSKLMLDAKYLDNIYDKLIEEGSKKDFCLMEYDFPTPLKLIKRLFKIDPRNEIPTDYSDSLRPDVLIFGNSKIKTEELEVLKVNKLKEPIGELMIDGTIRRLSEEDLKKRIGIRIIDVKLTRKEKVGKKYFFEILFYCLAMVYYLEQLGFREKFFVRADSNGIFPRYIDIDGLKISDVRPKIVKMPFRDTYILYESISNQLETFYKEIPCKIQDIPLHIQSTCARCSYLEDCKATLNFQEDVDPSSWDLRLLPYTSRTIAEQLKDSDSPKYKTIEDVAKKIENHPIENVPTPIFAEKPFLKMRAKALMKQKPIKPKERKTFSFRLPKYNNISLIMDLETDAIHDVVCACSLYLDIFISENAPFYQNFEEWWDIWLDYAEGNNSLDDTIIEILNEFDLNQNLENINPDFFLQEFADIIEYLLRHRNNLDYEWINLDKEAKKSNFKFHTLNLEFALVNEGFSEKDENDFSKKFINLLYSLVVLIQNLEWFLSVNDKYISSAIFYWSQEQIDYLEELLERNLDFLTDDPNLRKRTLYLLRWFNPSESSVKNPHHYKKFYDLRSFAETMMSFPLIINYTWHELAQYLSRKAKYRKYFRYKKLNFYEIFWNPHFNYIDFQQWYLYLDKKGDEKEDLLKEIKNQMMLKVKTLNSLKQAFQQEGKTQLLGYNKPKSMEDFFEFDLPQDYHNIAQIWNMYENYTYAYQEFEIDKLRNLYPSFGLGKLESAKVERITQYPMPKKGNIDYYYEFKLKGISANVKISEGDWVILVPEILRELPRYKNYLWKIVIEDMIWKGDYYEINTRPWGNSLIRNLIEELEASIPFTTEDSLRDEKIDKIRRFEQIEKKMNRGEVPIEINETFYLYPQASNPWTSKLNDLIKICNFGDSWLGKVLSFKWGLTKNEKFHYPQEFPYKGWLPEIYMYAPKLLPSFRHKPDKLFTNIKPRPDASQKNAILKAMKHTVYGIQGPPGTGKTQTIAALIEEYILRNKDKGPLKILVMAFSYAALRVVFKNVINSKNNDGSSTEVNKAKLVFLRSRSREPPKSQKSFYDLWKKKNFELTKMPDETPIGEIKKDSEDKLEDLLDLDSNHLILFGNSHQLHNLNKRHYGEPKFTRFDFSFDLIVVDETSQVPVNYLLAGIQNVKNQRIYVSSKDPNGQSGNKIKSTDELKADILYLQDENANPLDPNNLTKLILVGDQNQLPPVQQVKPPKKLEPILDNLFGYYCDYHRVENDQLQFNYRSHQKIVDHTNFLNIYREKIKPKTNKDKKIEGDLTKIKKWNKKHPKTQIESWIIDVLNPEIPVGVLIHKNKYETAVSPLEAKVASEIVVAYYRMVMSGNIKVKLEKLQEKQRMFFNQKIGVVAPHNAQGRLIVREIFQKLIMNDINYLGRNELMELLKKNVYSVEKFQGSARDLIIASIGISAEDQLLSEEEFIYDLNRFNVLSSRARAKFVFVCSEKFLTYIPQEQESMINSSKIRQFAFKFCSKNTDLRIQHDGKTKTVQFRFS